MNIGNILRIAALGAILSGPAAAAPQMDWVKTGCVIIDNEATTVAVNVKAERETMHVKFTFRDIATGQDKPYLRWIKFIPPQQTNRFLLPPGRYTLSIQRNNDPDDRGITTQNDIVVPPFVVDIKNGTKSCRALPEPGATTPQR